MKTSQFDQGYAAGLTFASNVAWETARALQAKGDTTKWRAGADALLALAGGLDEARSAVPAPAAGAPLAPAQIAAPAIEHAAHPVPPAAIPAIAASADDLRGISRAQGYTGDVCNDCGNLTMVRNGSCLKCDTCGGTTGCS